MTSTRPVRFSLRFRLISAFLIVMVVLLVLSNFLFYTSTKRVLEKDTIKQNELVSQQINLEVKQSQLGQAYIDSLLGNELRIAALAAKHALPAHAADVSNQMLVALSKEMGISGITLFQAKSGDIVGVKSSDPKEIGLSTKGMGLWYIAFRDLLARDPSKSTYGTAEKNYWTGPFANATSNPSKIDKWGYYYDGTTNYIIDPFIETSDIVNYSKYVGANVLIQKIEKSEPQILSIAVLNTTFGSKPVTYAHGDTTWVDVANEPVLYGNYAYQNKVRDVSDQRRAESTNQIVSVTETVDGKKVLKTFVPQTVSGKRLVVEVVSDYSVVTTALLQETHCAMAISLGLLLIIILLSYAAAEFLVRPLRRITETVDQIASHNFSSPLTLNRSDEIGVLADRVNAMSQNLLEFFQNNIRKERNQGMEYLLMTTHALVHELGNPLVAMKHLSEFLPKVQPDLNEKGREIVQRMSSASDYANRIAREFTDFLKNGRLHFRREDVVSLLEEALSLSKPLADSIGVDLSFANHTNRRQIMIEMDEDKLLMAVMNLIKNGLDAISSDQVNGRVRVELSLLESELQIDVIDTGSGIPEEQWTSIFMPYSSTKKSGLGLGLTFSGFVVLAHGGVIEVVESALTGTTMRIRLPYEADA